MLRMRTRKTSNPRTSPSIFCRRWKRRSATARNGTGCSVNSRCGNSTNGCYKLARQLQKLKSRGTRRTARTRRGMPPAAQIVIRLAGPKDAAAIAAVLHEAFVEFKPLYTEEGFAATAAPNADQVATRIIEGPVW